MNGCTVMDLNVFLINLPKDKERLLAATAQLERLSVPYERMEAVYAKELATDVRESAVNRFRWWCAVGRSCWVGEIGCALSHYKIYAQMIKRGLDYACILEDDVILSDGFKDALTRVEAWLDVSCPQVVLLSNHTSECGVGDEIRRAKSDMYAEGYVITRKAAEHLLAANLPLQVPCDHWGRWVKMGIIELYHAFPSVCTQDQTRYESGTRDAHCFNVRDLCASRYLWYKSKRVIGRGIDTVLCVLDKLRRSVWGRRNVKKGETISLDSLTHPLPNAD